jgi:4-amino-4-deoxy-L-arabinose transferase-like glycosyltransferase
MGDPQHSSRLGHYSLYVILAIGVLLRCILFPHLPPGLNQDEAAAGYEAYSLLLSGQDRWGNPFPIYFPSWGSGQNVLYSYLSIPVIAAWGLNPFSTRLIGLIFGIATLPLMYVCVARVCHPKIALYSTALLAVLPWHLMLSRWGLESNLLPFFLLLGVYWINLALVQQASWFHIVRCLLPWAVGLYAYALSIVVLPVFLGLVAYFERKRIYQQKFRWFCAFLVFLGAALPLLLFLVKNHILGDRFGFEAFLPFSIPLLPSQRLNQATHSLGDSLIFLINGFNDELVWNTSPSFLPLFMLPFPFFGIGMVVLIQRLKRGRANFFLLWFLSTLPLMVITRLNVNRANAMFIPVIVISVIGFQVLLQSITRLSFKRIVFRVVSGWLGLSALLFTGSYFSVYGQQAGYKFQEGFSASLHRAQQHAKPGELIFVTQAIPLNYIYVLFFQPVNPREFHQRADYRIENGIYVVDQLDRFYFNRDALAKASPQSFVYLQRADEKPLCPYPISIAETKFWTVGRCLKGMPSHP